MINNSIKERRRFKRYSIDGCIVQFRESRILGLFSKLSRKHMVMDISESGIHFVRHEELKEGQKVSLTISAPVIKDELIHVQGQVIRVKEISGLATHSVGIEFGDIDAENGARLKTLVKNAAGSKGDISSYIDIGIRFI
ncbi:MAG: PilZ domain-containing protein [Planctomycetota bacterium]